jgi:hypothetical protein
MLLQVIQQPYEYDRQQEKTPGIIGLASFDHKG